MTPTNPAIVAHAAAKRLPRLALVLFCLAYLLPGFIGRDAWKSADASGLGFMAELAQGSAQWLHPTLMGMPAETPALLPYWLGAWALQWAPAWVAPDFAARIPFVFLLALCMLGTWYGTYYLARSPKAQPVAFAFGGEASPKDYARAVADGGLLALIACLGLAQLAHETTPAAAQTAFTAIVFYAVAALPYHPLLGTLAFGLGLSGLSLCGAPTMALLYGVGGLCIHWLDSHTEIQNPQAARTKGLTSYAIVLAMVVAGALAYALQLWRWKIELPQASYGQWRGFAELLLWFTWPAWPLAVWTIWGWRRQILSRHISRHLAVPLWFVGVTLLGTVTSNASDRALMLSLPPMAALAAFALPTLRRQVAALIDWFTLLFFTSCAIIVWVVWIAMQTGFPSQPAANVARLAPGFEARFSILAFGIALGATLVWGWLVQWRAGRHRTAIWKSLVLPAGGAALCWLLLMTLWLPLLNYAQSYNAMVNRVVEQMNPPGCAETIGLSEGKIAALQFYGKLQLRSALGAYRAFGADGEKAPQRAQFLPDLHPHSPAMGKKDGEKWAAAALLQPASDKPDRLLDKGPCPWLIAEPGDNFSAPQALDEKQWILLAPIRHPTDGNESVLVFRRR